MRFSPARRRGRRSTPTSARPTSGADRRSLFWRLRRPLFLFALLLVAGLAGVVLVLSRVPLPAEAVPDQTTFLYDATGAVLAELHGGEDRVSVPLGDVPDVLIDAVISVEDRDFFEHRGIDASAIARATWADIRANGVAQGGSTITQQYVKSVYVGTERSLWRKLREGVLAVKLERKLDKEEILERYLNTIYLGRGAYGVQAAAQTWFGIDVGELELRQAAFLAGLIRAPEAADPERDPAEADRRRDLAVASMEEEGYVEAAEASAARAEPVASYVEPRRAAGEEINGGDVGTQFFVDYVRAYLTERYGEAAVYGGGLRVDTTIDLAMQGTAYQAVYGTLDRPEDPAGALVAIDDDGHVKAMVGGRDHGASKVNLAVGVDGGGSGRQAGSAFKPFVLAEAVEQGISVESSFPSPSTVVIPGADNGVDYEVDNYGGASHGRIDLLHATRVSSNTVYAQLMDEVGPDQVVDMAERMGIRSELPPVASLTLGTAEVSPLEMADAYLTLATRGVQVAPLVVTRVTDADGRVLEEREAERETVLEPAQADVVTDALRGVVERGTGTAARTGDPVAGKTGTTQEYGDAWFVGFTRRLSVAVWMGYPESRRPMDDVHGRAVTGGSFPATIFREFLTGVAESYRSEPFVAPESFGGRVLNGRAPDPDDTTTTTGSSTTTSSTSSTSTPPTSTSTTAPPTTTSVAPPTTVPP